MNATVTITLQLTIMLQFYSQPQRYSSVANHNATASSAANNLAESLDKHTGRQWAIIPRNP
jgi:hypothetical protein